MSLAGVEGLIDFIKSFKVAGAVLLTSASERLSRKPSEPIAPRIDCGCRSFND